jgi:hypothetical protein
VKRLMTRPALHDDPQERKAIHPRHFEVESDQVRLQIDDLAQRFLAIAGITDDLHCRQRLQHLDDGSPIVGRIIHYQHPHQTVQNPSSGAAVSAGR